MSALLTVDGVSKRFGGLMALSDVGFEVKEGEILGLIGPNGAGKTTMFNCVAGVIRPTVGDLLFRAWSIPDTSMGEVSHQAHGRGPAFQGQREGLKGQRVQAREDDRAGRGQDVSEHPPVY